MPLFTIVVSLVIVGVLLWLVNSYIEKDPKIKKIINVVVIIVTIIWLTKVLGLWQYLNNVHT